MKKKSKPRYPTLQKLKGKLLEFNYSYQDAAEELCITATTFCQKINGYLLFNSFEIRVLADWLMIPDAQIAECFIPTANFFKAVRKVLEKEVKL